MSTSQPRSTGVGAPGPRRSRAPTRKHHLLEPYRRLFWRVFALNASVLMLACALAVVVFSPGTFSSQVALKELGIFLGALSLMVAANLVLTRRITAPLEELVTLMRRVDPLHPGARVTVRGGPSEATELAHAFNEMLDRLEHERDESTRRALDAQESERLRVAQELHDEVGQNLTAALLQLARLRKRAPEELRAELTEAAETVRENLDDLRRIAQRLRPQSLDELGLASALGHFSDRLSDQTGLPIERTFAHDLPVLSYDEELVIYRVAQEALTNVVRHAHASRAELTLERVYDSLVLRVSDDGRGLAGSGAGTGGIRGMHERAALIHGDLRVAAREPRGTEVALHVPIGAEGQ
ncbi:MAG: histidine kinase [Actinomycetota bacterium]|nr:histidine kinase [Actinomycetota bacterium]